MSDIRLDLIPAGDKVAEKRFNEGVKSASQYIFNLLETEKTSGCPKNMRTFKLRGDSFDSQSYSY